MNRYVLRFDDVAPGMAWSRFLPLKARMEALGVPVLLGVVPDNRDPTLDVEPRRADFFDLVRRWRAGGDAVAQHGTFHVYDSDDGGLLDINRRSEFSGHPYALQRDRLAHGKRLLEGEGVWDPWFMAPSHSFDETTLRVLAELGFRALTDGYGFRPYRREGLWLVPSLTARPIFPTPGIGTICVHVNTLEPAAEARLRRFVERHARRVMPFAEAVPSGPSRPSGFGDGGLMRAATRVALRGTRALRRAVRRSGAGAIDS